jgi:hypothetical protein
MAVAHVFERGVIEPLLFTTATSCFHSTGRINISSGCFAVAGNCLSILEKSLRLQIAASEGHVGKADLSDVSGALTLNCQSPSKEAVEEEPLFLSQVSPACRNRNRHLRFSWSRIKRSSAWARLPSSKMLDTKFMRPATLTRLFVCSNCTRRFESCSRTLVCRARWMG